MIDATFTRKKSAFCVKSVSQIFILPAAGRDIPNNAGIVIGQNVLYSVIWENSKSRARSFDFVEDTFDDDWSIEAIFAKWLPQLKPFLDDLDSDSQSRFFITRRIPSLMRPHGGHRDWRAT